MIMSFLGLERILTCFLSILYGWLCLFLVRNVFLRVFCQYFTDDYVFSWFGTYVYAYVVNALRIRCPAARNVRLSGSVRHGPSICATAQRYASIAPLATF